MKKQIKYYFLAIIACLVTAQGVARADSVGINLQKTSATDVTGSAGVVSQANWNNGAGKTGSMATGTLVDDSGSAVSGMAVSWAFSGNPVDIKADNQTQTPDGGDVNLLRSGVEVNVADYGLNSISVTTVPYAKYDLYVYIQGYQEGTTRNGYATLNGIGATELGFSPIGFDYTSPHTPLSTSTADADEARTSCGRGWMRPPMAT